MFPVDVFFLGGVPYRAFFLGISNKLIRYCLETTQTYQTSHEKSRDFAWFWPKPPDFADLEASKSGLSTSKTVVFQAWKVATFWTISDA